VIRSFRCADTARLFDDHHVARFREIEWVARRKFLYLDAVRKLDDLRVPPGNRLEQLKRDRVGTFSIRVNERWQIVLRGGTAKRTT
jgi:proteic killer suppression protein